MGMRAITQFGSLQATHIGYLSDDAPNILRLIYGSLRLFAALTKCFLLVSLDL